MNILIVRIGRLGDMVMVLPALQEIKRQYPHANIYAITSQDGIRILKCAGMQAENLFLFRSTFIYRAIDRVKAKRFIKKHHFERIYCFELKKKLVSLLPKSAICLQPTDKLEHYALRSLKLINPQIPERMLYQKNYLTVPQEGEVALEKILNQEGIDKNTLLVGFHPTFSGYATRGRRKQAVHRLWPAHDFAQLALKLMEYARAHHIKLKIIVDLLPEEYRLAEQIKELSQNKVILLPAKPDFQRYLCLLKRLNVLIVPNTGVMHLAAALGTPMVALFSAFHPEDCGPYMAKEKYHVLRAEETENPEMGLTAIRVEDVFVKTLALLNLENAFV